MNNDIKKDLLEKLTQVQQKAGDIGFQITERNYTQAYSLATQCEEIAGECIVTIGSLPNQ